MIIQREDRAVFADQLQERRRGRPRRQFETQRASVELPTPVFDALCHRARAERKSLHALMCELLAMSPRPDFR